MKKILASVVLALLFLLGTASGILAQSPSGAISGQVVNGTAGGTLPADLQVNVQGIKGSEFLPLRSVAANGDGRFRIDGLETGADYSYVVYAEYLGIQYGADTIVFDGTASEVETDVVIYETATSDEAISLARIHFVVSVVDGALEVAEVQSFSNSGDRTFIGAEPAAGAPRTTVRFAPPQAAQDLQLDEDLTGTRFVQTSDGYADTLPVVPGQGTMQVVFSYFLPYDPASTPLSTTLLYPTNAVNVFLPDAGVELISDRLALMGTMGSGAQAFVGYVGQNFARGETLTLEFKGESKGGTVYPAASGGGTSNLGVILVVGGLALLLAAAAFAYPALRRRRDPTAAHEPSITCDDECEELLAAIADLDDLLEAGELDEETHRRRRQALKARLLEMQQASKE